MGTEASMPSYLELHQKMMKHQAMQEQQDAYANALGIFGSLGGPSHYVSPQMQPLEPPPNLVLLLCD